MNDKHRFEPDDQDLPEGWKPENTPDPQLETILQLARETDKTITPLPAAFEALRLSMAFAPGGGDGAALVVLAAAVVVRRRGQTMRDVRAFIDRVNTPATEVPVQRRAVVH